MGIDKNKLEYYYKLVNATILSIQDVITGLIPASRSNSHSWVRDNVYVSLSMWGLSMAYRKVPDVDEDRSRGYELEKRVVNLMRGLLKCYMYQADKVENFKKTQCPSFSLHAKFDSRTCKAVVGDHDWGHLQIDAVSLYLLVLAQMTASGLRIIWTLDEVAFIQNLVFYIEPASRIPDYGIWERGDKTNHGFPELNTSSVGLAKAALESLNGLDLFGPQGGANSTIHCLMDECEKCNTVLENMLPRESYSKETGAALIGIISYPGFAVTDEGIIERTRNTVLSKLLGSYGCIRFLRDGYKTAREDSNRLHYEPWELRRFEGIECQWPLFLTYLVIGACFDDNFDLAKKYMDQLDQVVLRRKIPQDTWDPSMVQLTSMKPATVTDDTLYPIMPELYSLPAEKIDAEISDHNSQVRIPIGSAPHLWGQSMYILSCLIMDRLLLPGEIDPLGRRMAADPKPDLVVQVVVLAENDLVKENLAEYNLDVQTPSEVVGDSGIQIYPAKVLLLIYNQLGVCPKLGLTGRTAKNIGVISTSSLYRIGNTTMAFTPQVIFTTGIWYRDAKLSVEPDRSSGGYVGSYPLIREKLNEAYLLYNTCLDTNFRILPILIFSDLLFIAGSVVYTFAGPLVILSREAFYNYAMLGSALLGSFMLLNRTACMLLFDCLQHSQAVQVDNEGSYVENLHRSTLFEIKSHIEEASTTGIGIYLTLLGYLPIVIMGVIKEKVLGRPV